MTIRCKIYIWTLKFLTSESTPLVTQFFKRAYKNRLPPRFYASRIALLCFTTLSKIGSDFSKKVDSKLKLPKNHFNKKCAPKLLFFNEKIRKIWMIFDIENWFWKSNFGTSQRRDAYNHSAYIFSTMIIIVKDCWFCKTFWKIGLSKVSLWRLTISMNSEYYRLSCLEVKCQNLTF